LARSRAANIGIPDDGTWPSILALVAGFAYCAAGVLQLLASTGLVGPVIGFTDFLGGLLLVVVAAVFLAGVRPLSRNKKEGYAFIVVGYILAAVLFVLQIMVILTNGLGWILGFEDWTGWNIYNDITPSLWMFIILMTTTGLLWVMGNFREKLLPTAGGVHHSDRGSS
jgi:hypothetical protein